MGPVMTELTPRRMVGMSLAWAGLVLLVAGLVLWILARYVTEDLSAFWSAAALVLGFVLLAAASMVMKGTRDRAGRLDRVDAEPPEQP
jgi:membrane-bound ClpP family serine protease